MKSYQTEAGRDAEDAVWERKEGSENQMSEAEIKGQQERRGKLERTGYRGFEIPDAVLLFWTTRTGIWQLKGGDEVMESQRPKYRPECW